MQGELNHTLLYLFSLSKIVENHSVTNSCSRSRNLGMLLCHVPFGSDIGAERRRIRLIHKDNMLESVQSILALFWQV
jgi:hypothetical protein